MSDLNEEIKNAIQKNLPATVADELKEFIATAQLNERKLAQAILEKTNANQQAREMDSKLSRANEELTAFKLREQEFKSSEHKVQTAYLNEQVAKAKLEGAMEVTKLVFANNIVKKNYFDAVNKNTAVPSGSYTTPTNESHSVNETTEG